MLGHSFSVPSFSSASSSFVIWYRSSENLPHLQSLDFYYGILDWRPLHTKILYTLIHVIAVHYSCSLRVVYSTTSMYTVVNFFSSIISSAARFFNIFTATVAVIGLLADGVTG